MELQLFLRTRTNEAPGEQVSKPNARVNPELAQHHDTNAWGAVEGRAALVWDASTMRRAALADTVRLWVRGGCGAGSSNRNVVRSLIAWPRHRLLRHSADTGEAKQHSTMPAPGCGFSRA